MQVGGCSGVVAWLLFDNLKFEHEAMASSPVGEGWGEGQVLDF